MLRRGFVGAEAGDRAEADSAWKEPWISRASIFLASIFLFPRRMEGRRNTIQNMLIVGSCVSNEREY